MLAVGLKVLKNRLAEYVRMAARGETILVTDRDRVVAELSPPRPERSPMAADALLAELVRKGWLSPPVFVSSGEPPRLPTTSLEQLMSDIAADRGDR